MTNGRRGSPRRGSWLPALSSIVFALLPALTIADPLIEAFVSDSTFNGGYLLDDRFATSYLYTDFYGSKTARLGNGDIVVAGLVPSAYADDQGNGLFNIGLVRYGPSGERVPWPGPSAEYVSFYDRYLQYPNSYSNFGRIADLIVVNGYIYVMADYVFSSTQRDVDLIVFRDDGTFVGIYIGSAALYESGVGMVTINSGGSAKLFTVNQITRQLSQPKVGTRWERYLALSRFDIDAGGGLSADATFGSAGRLTIADPNCSVLNGDCDVEATAISLVGSGTAILGPYVVYTIGDSNCNPVPNTFCTVTQSPLLQVLRLSPSTGSLLSRTTVALHDPLAGNQQLDADARDIVATRAVLLGGGYSDSTYALARVQGYCNGVYRRGAGVVRIDGDGYEDTNFGTAGTLVFGGQPATDTCPPPDIPTAEPAALALGAYGRLAVVGTTSDKATSPTHSDGFLAVVRVDLGGGLADYAVHPALQYNGQPWGNYAGFADVLAYDNGTFVAAGAVTTPYNAYQFGTTRFRSDRIFADDFSTP